MSEDIAGSSFLGTNNNFFLPESRTMSFAVEEEDPWSAAGFDPVNDMRQPLAQSQTMDEELVTEGITAANVLGMYLLAFSLIHTSDVVNFSLSLLFSRSRST